MLKPMRNEKEMMELILSVAEADERIRAVLMLGSRANSDAPKDIFQDFDITYSVNDIRPFYDNMEWVCNHFGKPIITQLPDKMEEFPQEDHFTYLMIFDDGNRIDLTFDFAPYIDDGEPAIILLDKDNCLSPISVNPSYFHTKEPTEKLYNNCCNEFWWCLNNVAKGIARDELPYAMEMLNDIVRGELHHMISWYIGVETNFTVSAGKMGKYFKRYLESNLYEKYRMTYSDSDYSHLWNAIFTMCELFREVAKKVGICFGYSYPCRDDENMTEYLRWVQSTNRDNPCGCPCKQ